MKRSHKIGIGLGATLGIISLSWFVINSSGIENSETKKPAQVLDLGWQFYFRPTTLEPAGTVFRIDKSGKRYLVEVMEVNPLEGDEVSGKAEQIIETEIGILARFLGKTGPSISSTGKKIEKVRFEMIDTKRAVTTDKAIDDLLKNFGNQVRYRKDSRYFVIREVRSAMEINYTFTEDIVHEMGGEASLEELANVKGDIFHKKDNSYLLNQKFSQRMRVMFLPEEILLTGHSLSGSTPEFEAVPVKEVLKWTEN